MSEAEAHGNSSCSKVVTCFDSLSKRNQHHKAITSITSNLHTFADILGIVLLRSVSAKPRLNDLGDWIDWLTCTRHEQHLGTQGSVEICGNDLEMQYMKATLTEFAFIAALSCNLSLAL